jgi:hypothetical protein
MIVAAVRVAGATKTTAVTAMVGGTNHNQLKAIRGTGRNGGSMGTVIVAMTMETAAAMEMATVTAMMLSPTPSALPSKQFLLCRLLSLIRVLIYSSSHCAFRRPLLSCHLPVSMTALPLL